MQDRLALLYVDFSEFQASQGLPEPGACAKMEFASAEFMVLGQPDPLTAS